MKAASRTVKQLFQTDVRFLVPMYQRPYVWTADRQWQPLIEDLCHVADRLLRESVVGVAGNQTPEERTPPHFLGAVVVDQERHFVGSVDRRLIIDGQQRLTTLQLILAVVRDIASELGDTRSAAQLRKLVQNGEEVVEPGRPEEQWKVWPTNADRQAFLAVMTGAVDQPPSRFAEARKFFHEAVQDWVLDGEEGAEARVRALSSALQNHIEVVAIELERDDNAQVIFETLNDRGEPLLAGDLVKNYVFQNLSPGVDSDVIYESLWRPFDQPRWRTGVRQGRLKRPRLDVFLQHWLTLRMLEEVNATELFAAFKVLHSRASGPVESLLGHLAADSASFDALDVAARDEPHSIEGTFVYRWRNLEQTTFTPVVLMLFSPDVPDSDRQRGLLALESWMVRRALCRSTAKDVNRLVLDLVTRLSKADGLPGEALELELAEPVTDTRRWPSDMELGNVLVDQPIYGRVVQRRLAMVLEAIEDDIRTERSAEQRGPRQAGLEIEHVMPQEWRTYWRTPGMDELAAQRRDQIVQKLGNLTLVTGTVNKLLRNHPWTEDQAVAVDAPVPKPNSPRGKRNVLAQHSTLLLNADLCTRHPDAWTETTIEDRGRWLAGRIMEIWPRPQVADDFPVPHFNAEERAALLEIPRARSSIGRSLTNIPDGTTVRFRGTSAVVRDGRMHIGDRTFATPSAAAVEVAHGIQHNGWRVWKLVNGVSLADFHDNR